MKLYHGTNAANLEAILKQGIKPRYLRKTKGNWQHSIESNPRSVYLTNCYALYFAFSAKGKSKDLAIIEIDTDRLNPFRFAPDEDYLEQASRGQALPEAGQGMHERTRYYRKKALSHYQHYWKDSLEGLGTCGYYGLIPPDAITRVATLPPNGALAWASDPTISLLNHAIMANYYEQLTKHVFGDPIEAKIEDDPFGRIAAMADIPRDKVEVKEINP